MSKKEKGRIIVISGGPRCGKSTLVRILAKEYKGSALLEGEAKDFPEQIWKNIADDVDIFQTQLWFRNQKLQQYIKAKKLKKQGKTVFLDTFWITNQVYTKTLLSNKQEIALLQEIHSIDGELLSLPDLVITLSTNEKRIREFVSAGGRPLEQNEKHVQRSLALNNAHEAHFQELPLSRLAIDRSNIDFFDTKEVENLIKQIQEKLQ